MNFLRLIRPVNLVLIALVQLVAKYGLFQNLEASMALDGVHFAMLLLATLSIAAGGYIINDIYDVEIDKINKPTSRLIGKTISEKYALRAYFICTVTGVVLGFYLSNSIQRPGFAALFIVIAALLYLYASYLKGVLVVGNVVIAGLVAISLLILGLFDLLPAITVDNRETQATVFRVLMHYSLFALLLNFIRELVKDILDINGDKNGGLSTLPIAIGRKRTITIVFLLGLLLTLLIVGYMYSYLYHDKVMVLYFLFLIVAPMLYFCVRAWNAEQPKDYLMLSRLLKLIMLFGICSMAFYPRLFEL
ncbi:geranylgeranylglycerol-phosphate geranylgeranyltransferase [Altibacter sp.]|mgnify:CR=1 FL=1|uniref:geranylgeranylglycerol-phosphate geranylgeranyltransferase n=1 Tax=Altibacter sp. TaxID=2024823 RepID=UPI000C8F8340|nr:geranylgeranylglycerol-phosphate geranylgeranyltransferase [Altibacter sp.]MAP53452.1 prenyltransferase [Altibacter sp.]